MDWRNSDRVVGLYRLLGLAAWTSVGLDLLDVLGVQVDTVRMVPVRTRIAANHKRVVVWLFANAVQLFEAPAFW